MTYERINFVDQSVERPRTYEMTHNADGSVTLTDSFGLVDELGTPINADTMNHLEDGIDSKQDKLVAGDNIEIKNNVISAKSGSLPIGQIISMNCSDSYVPDGTLPCDGTEYAKSQFADLWDNFLTGELETISTFIPIEGITKNGKSYVFDCATLGSGRELDFYFNFITGNDITTKQTLFELNENSIVLEGGVLNYEGSFDESNDEFSPYSLTENTVNNVRVLIDGSNFVVLINDFEILSFNSYSLITFIASSSFLGSFDLSNGELNDAPLGETITETKMKTSLNICDYSEYQEELSTYGQCAKFAVDTNNETFRVPLIKDGAVIQQALTSDELGKAYNAGLPNIEGTFGAENRTGVEPTGAFTKSDGKTSGDDTGLSRAVTYTFNASASNSIYGNSDTVQPNAVALRYFVVVANGQTNQSLMDWSAWASSLQGKMNADHSNDSKPYIVEVSDKSLMPSWYRVWSDGWCEQGGKQYSTSSGWIDITLLKEYTNLEYSIITSRAKPYSSSTSTTHAYVADSAAIVNYTTVTTTSFQYYSQNDDGTHFTSWEAKGYIKE